MIRHRDDAPTLPLSPTAPPVVAAHVEGFTRDDRVAWNDQHGLRHTGRVLAALPHFHCHTIRDDRGTFAIVNLYPFLTPIERL